MPVSPCRIHNSALIKEFLHDMDIHANLHHGHSDDVHLIRANQRRKRKRKDKQDRDKTYRKMIFWFVHPESDSEWSEDCKDLDDAHSRYHDIELNIMTEEQYKEWNDKNKIKEAKPSSST
jgi:hypothetical protein